MIFRYPEVERLALAIHDASHEGLRCEYQCDFWHNLGRALALVAPGDLASAGVRFDVSPAPDGTPQQS